MKNTSILTYSIVSSLLTGCASYYKLPDGLESAQMSFRTNARPVMVQAFSNENCGSSSYGTRLAYIDPMFDSAGKHAGPTKIEAGKPLIFTLKKTTVPNFGGYTCGMTFKFTPEPGQEYVASLYLDESTCRYSVKKVVGSREESIPDLEKLPEVCYSNNA